MESNVRLNYGNSSFSAGLGCGERHEFGANTLGGRRGTSQKNFAVGWMTWRETKQRPSGHVGPLPLCKKGNIGRMCQGYRGPLRPPVQLFQRAPWMWDHSLKHVVAIFAERSKRERVKGWWLVGRGSVRGERIESGVPGWWAERWGCFRVGGISFPRSFFCFSSSSTVF